MKEVIDFIMKGLDISYIYEDIIVLVCILLSLILIIIFIKKFIRSFK
ncbi:hypothetical protein [Anaerofustis stercorihominis]|nr:hypothetical protein [Anaerofustis stercorihominis]MCR2033798.1 hypothetical protein [Anaerofustis stercorihominis]